MRERERKIVDRARFKRNIRSKVKEKMREDGMKEKRDRHSP